MELIPDLVDNFTTAGKVDIHIKTLKNVNESDHTKLSFHSHQIKILEDTVTVTKANDPSIVLNVVGHEYDIDRLFYVIHLAQVISLFFFLQILRLTKILLIIWLFFLSRMKM